MGKEQCPLTPTTILWYGNYQALATRDIVVVPRHCSPRGGTYDRACDRSYSISRAAPVHPCRPLRSRRSGEAHQAGVPRRLGRLRRVVHPARLRAHAHDARVHGCVSREPSFRWRPSSRDHAPGRLVEPGDGRLRRSPRQALAGVRGCLRGAVTMSIPGPDPRHTARDTLMEPLAGLSSTEVTERLAQGHTN